MPLVKTSWKNLVPEEFAREKSIPFSWFYLFKFPIFLFSSKENNEENKPFQNMMREARSNTTINLRNLPSWPENKNPIS